MDSFIKKLQKYQLLRAVFYALVGILILLQPRPFFNVIVYIVAAYFVFLSIVNLISAWREKKATGYYGSEMTIGILFLVVAAIVLIFAKLIISIIPFFLGLLVLLSGIRQLVQELNLRKQGISSLGWFLFSLAMIVVGGVLVFNPFGSVLVLFQIFGAVLIVLAISEIIAYFQLKKN